MFFLRKIWLKICSSRYTYRGFSVKIFLKKDILECKLNPCSTEGRFHVHQKRGNFPYSTVFVSSRHDLSLHMGLLMFVSIRTLAFRSYCFQKATLCCTWRHAARAIQICMTVPAINIVILGWDKKIIIVLSCKLVEDIYMWFSELYLHTWALIRGYVRRSVYKLQDVRINKS